MMVLIRVKMLWKRWSEATSTPWCWQWSSSWRPRALCNLSFRSSLLCHRSLRLHVDTAPSAWIYFTGVRFSISFFRLSIVKLYYLPNYYLSSVESWESSHLTASLSLRSILLVYTHFSQELNVVLKTNIFSTNFCCAGIHSRLPLQPGAQYSIRLRNWTR